MFTQLGPTKRVSVLPSELGEWSSQRACGFNPLTTQPKHFPSSHPQNPDWSWFILKVADFGGRLCLANNHPSNAPHLWLKTAPQVFKESSGCLEAWRQINAPSFPWACSVPQQSRHFSTTHVVLPKNISKNDSVAQWGQSWAMCDCNSWNQRFSCLQEQLLAALSLAPCLGQPLLDGTDLTINNMWHFELEVWEIHGSRNTSIMKWHDISMLLCPWWFRWFYFQICSAFLWVFQPLFSWQSTWKLLQLCSQPASSINFNSTVACSLPGQPLWPEKDLGTDAVSQRKWVQCNLPFCTPRNFWNSSLYNCHQGFLLLGKPLQSAHRVSWWVSGSDPIQL